MRRLAFYLNLLAVLASLAGGLGIYLSYRPSTSGEWSAALRAFAAVALASPWVAVAALVAISATIAVRVLDRPSTIERRRPVHTLPQTSATAPSPAKPATVASARSESERLRQRLQAALRRRGDSVVELVDELLAGALRCRASDVHVQPREGFTRISLRVQGELVDVATAEEDRHAKIVRRLKVLANLVPYKAEPQDGRFSLRTAGAAVDVRVSIVPTQHGEKVALRFLKGDVQLLGIDELGMDAAASAAFRGWLAQPQGLVVLTGPTGSGKTTTLYSALGHIHETRGERTQIASIEDPVEIELPFMSQTQVDRSQELDFPAGLRALLRQDPNVLMVGEIRDAETARTAVQAGLSGHLILTSLHAESASGVFARLIDMGSEPFLVASSTLACVSQRLVRCLCADCRRPVAADRKTAARLAQRGVVLDPGTSFYRADGCRGCEETGVRGRTAVFEMLGVSPELRRLITSGVMTQQIEETALREGMKPLLRAAVEMAAAGRISLEEVARIAG